MEGFFMNEWMIRLTLSFRPKSRNLSLGDFAKCSFLSIRKEPKEVCTLKINAKILFHYAKRK